MCVWVRVCVRVGSWYLFYRHMDGIRINWHRHFSNGEQPMLKAVYHRWCCDENNCRQSNLILARRSSDHCKLHQHPDSIMITAHTHMHTYTQPFYSSLNFVWNKPGEPVPAETFTHSLLLWSLFVPYLLHPPIAIHGILPVQFMCLTVFFNNLAPSFLWYTSWPGTLHFILHFFTQSLAWSHQWCHYCFR